MCECWAVACEGTGTMAWWGAVSYRLRVGCCFYFNGRGHSYADPAPRWLHFLPLLGGPVWDDVFMLVGRSRVLVGVRPLGASD